MFRDIINEALKPYCKELIFSTFIYHLKIVNQRDAQNVRTGT